MNWFLATGIYFLTTVSLGWRWNADFTFNRRYWLKCINSSLSECFNLEYLLILFLVYVFMHTLMIEARIIKGCEVNQEFLLIHYMSRCVVYLSVAIFSRIPAFGMMSDMGLQVLKVERLESITVSVMNWFWQILVGICCIFGITLQQYQGQKRRKCVKVVNCWLCTEHVAYTISSSSHSLPWAYAVYTFFTSQVIPPNEQTTHRPTYPKTNSDIQAIKSIFPVQHGERDSTNKNGYPLNYFELLFTQVISQNAVLKCTVSVPLLSFHMPFTYFNFLLVHSFTITLTCLLSCFPH